jgi:tetratricopeptide (TPR) repeat protein
MRNSIYIGQLHRSLFMDHLAFTFREDCESRYTHLPMASGSDAPIDGDEHFREGLALSRRGQWKEAIAAYRESLKINPDNAQTYLNLGFVYYEMGFDREAQDAFDQASRLQARSCTR